MGASPPGYRRILVMGCSRSGTTLLQSLLASHSRIHTFPETGVFLKGLGMRGRALPWTLLGLTVGKERKALARLLTSQQQAPGPLPVVPRRRFSLSRSFSDIVTFFDELAEAHEKDVWVEKTPRHVLHARRIGRAIPGVLCFHMVRKGEDVVASIVDRAQRFPEQFPRQADPAYGIRQWNRSMRATQEALREPGHAVVFYESLVEGVEPTLRALCQIAGLEFEPALLRPADRSAFSTAQEEWKSQVNGLVEAAGSKFEKVFEEGTRDRITRGLETAVFGDLKERASEEPGGILFSGFGAAKAD